LFGIRDSIVKWRVIPGRVKNSNGLFRHLTGVGIGSERILTLTHQAAEGLAVLDVASSCEEIEQRVAQVVAGQ